MYKIIIMFVLLGGLLIVSVKTGIPRSFWEMQSQKKESIQIPKSQEEQQNISSQSVENTNDNTYNKQMPAGNEMVVSESELPPEQDITSKVLVHIDKQEYRLGEELIVTITNNLDTSIITGSQQTFCSIILLEGQEGTGWKEGHCSRDPGFDMDMASDHFYTTGSNHFSRGANNVWTG